MLFIKDPGNRMLAYPSPYTVCHVKQECHARGLTQCSIQPTHCTCITSIPLAERVPAFFNLHCAPMTLFG